MCYRKKPNLDCWELNEETIQRKGLDRFVNLSKSFPNIQFLHIGKWTDKHGKPSNKALKKLKIFHQEMLSF